MSNRRVLDGVVLEKVDNQYYPRIRVHGEEYALFSSHKSVVCKWRNVKDGKFSSDGIASLLDRAYWLWRIEMYDPGSDNSDSQLHELG